MPGAKVLDIGCGPANMLEFLPDVRYIGFDASEAYIAEAQKRWGLRGEFTCATVNAQNLQERGFDIVLAIGVLHHLDDQESRGLFNLAHEALRPGGRLVTLDGVYVSKQSPIARYLISKDRGEYVRHLDEYESLARGEFPDTKATVLHDLLAPMPYTHLIMECTRA
jgi:cyclopropane fatty-acyl-phospholipid synthase-like methyltransferase